MKYLNVREYSSDGVAHSEVRIMCEEQKQKEKNGQEEEEGGEREKEGEEQDRKR